MAESRAMIVGVLRAVMALAALTPAAAAAGTLTFRSDWENPDIVGNPGQFAEVQRLYDDRFVQSAYKPRAGRYSAQVTVKQGDNPLTDCETCGERAEALFMTDPNGNQINESVASGTQFYAFSVRLAPGWQSPTGTKDKKFGPVGCKSMYGWGIVLQLHGPNEYSGASAAFALQTWDTNNPGAKFTVGLNTGTLVLGDDTVNDGVKVLDLTKNDLAIGSWVDWIFQIKWADKATGFIKAWRRDAGQSNFTPVLSTPPVATLQRTVDGRSDDPHYWKTGFYRPKDCKITNQLWIEGPARGTSMDAVRKGLWGK